MAADTIKDFLETGSIRNSVNFPQTVRAVSRGFRALGAPKVGVTRGARWRHAVGTRRPSASSLLLLCALAPNSRGMQPRGSCRTGLVLCAAGYTVDGTTSGKEVNACCGSLSPLVSPQVLAQKPGHIGGRLCIVHKNVSGVLGQITTYFGTKGLNIEQQVRALVGAGLRLGLGRVHPQLAPRGSTLSGGCGLLLCSAFTSSSWLLCILRVAGAAPGVVLPGQARVSLCVRGAAA